MKVPSKMMMISFVYNRIHMQIQTHAIEHFLSCAHRCNICSCKLISMNLWYSLYWKLSICTSVRSCVPFLPLSSHLTFYLSLYLSLYLYPSLSFSSLHSVNPSFHLCIFTSLSLFPSPSPSVCLSFHGPFPPFEEFRQELCGFFRLSDGHCWGLCRAPCERRPKVFVSGHGSWPQGIGLMTNSM